MNNLTRIPLLALFYTLCVITQADANCFTQVTNVCSGKGQNVGLGKCTAAYRGFDDYSNKAVKDAEGLLRDHLSTSLNYLLIASEFKQWDAERPGFHSYFSKMSDAAWEDAIDLMHHITLRGQVPTIAVNGVEGQSIPPSEVEILGFALDKEKALTNTILRSISDDHKAHDPEFYHYLSEHLSDKRVMRLKTLANSVNTLKMAMYTKAGENGKPEVITGDDDDHKFAVHWFDTYMSTLEV